MASGCGTTLLVLEHISALRRARHLFMRSCGSEPEERLRSNCLTRISAKLTSIEAMLLSTWAPYTRRVTSLTLGLAHRDGVSKFQLAGIAGPVDPGSIFQGAGTAHTRSQYQFEVEFDIADEALHFYVVDGVALPAIQRYIKSVD